MEHSWILVEPFGTSILKLYDKEIIGYVCEEVNEKGRTIRAATFYSYSEVAVEVCDENFCVA